MDQEEGEAGRVGRQLHVPDPELYQLGVAKQGVVDGPHHGGLLDVGDLAAVEEGKALLQDMAGDGELPFRP